MAAELKDAQRRASEAVAKAGALENEERRWDMQ